MSVAQWLTVGSWQVGCWAFGECSETHLGQSGLRETSMVNDGQPCLMMASDIFAVPKILDEKIDKQNTPSLSGELAEAGCSAQSVKAVYRFPIDQSPVKQM